MKCKLEDQSQESFEEVLDNLAERKGYTTTGEIFRRFRIPMDPQLEQELSNYFSKEITFEQFQHKVRLHKRLIN